MKVRKGVISEKDEERAVKWRSRERKIVGH